MEKLEKTKMNTSKRKIVEDLVVESTLRLLKKGGYNYRFFCYLSRLTLRRSSELRRLPLAVLPDAPMQDDQSCGRHQQVNANVVFLLLYPNNESLIVVRIVHNEIPIRRNSEVLITASFMRVGYQCKFAFSACSLVYNP